MGATANPAADAVSLLAGRLALISDFALTSDFALVCACAAYTVASATQSVRETMLGLMAIPILVALFMTCFADISSGPYFGPRRPEVKPLRACSRSLVQKQG